MKVKRTELEAIAQPLAARLGLELYWLEVQRAGRRLRVTVYIDKPGGVSLEDCARLSRTLDEPFDRAIPGSYDLEVSSPGLDRPLYTPAHFAAAVGQAVYIQTRQPVEGATTWTGRLLSMRDDGDDHNHDDNDNDKALLLEPEAAGDGRQVRIPLSQIRRARIQPTL